jgi:hypothetical protein
MSTTLREELARRADQAGNPELDVDALIDLGERRLRRRQVGTVLATSAAVLLVIALVIGGATLIGPSKSTGPIDKPSPNPTPTPTRTERPHGNLHPPKGLEKLTPRQTVQSYNAQLIGALTSFDDPDVRISVWATACLVCPPMSGGRGPQVFNAIAVTDDGFRTATYLRPHMWILGSILSVGRNTFLLNDTGNGIQKLLSANGTLRRVRMVDETRTPNDPRLVFQCTGYPGGAFIGGWCVLDVASATAARLPATFVDNGDSAGDPGLGQRPWGTDVISNVDSAWWTDGGVSRYAALPQIGLTKPVPSLLRNDDAPTYVRWRPASSHRLDVFRVNDRSGGLTKVASRPWLPLTRLQISDPGHPNEIGISVDYARMPDGGLLAWSYREVTRRSGLTIWRAPSLTAGEFEVVYQGAPWTEWNLGFDPKVVLHDGRLHLDRLVSDDDGRTWTEQVTSWR